MSTAGRVISGVVFAGVGYLGLHFGYSELAPLWAGVAAGVAGLIGFIYGPKAWQVVVELIS